MNLHLKYSNLLILLSTIFFTCSSRIVDHSNNSDILSSLSTAPDTVPQVFAKGIISTERVREGAITFSPDMKVIYFTSMDSTTRVRIMEMKYSNGSWTQPIEWEHSNLGNNHEPFVTPNGRNLYFVSNRHAPDVKGSGRIWMTSRINAQWNAPRMLFDVKSDKGLWFPSVSAKGTLFFGGYLDSLGCYGKSDIYSYSLNGNEGQIKNLGEVINSPFEEWDPYIAPDESYLLFESDRPGGYGAVDIYISFKEEGRWSQPINLGPTINTSAYEVAARVSPDGKYLFFDRPFKTEQDIHWVSSAVIEKLRVKFRNSKAGL